MRREDLLRRPVEDIDLGAVGDVAPLVRALEAAGGFTAKKVGVAAEVLRRMVEAPGCTTFLAFPAALMATGVRGVLRGLVEHGLVDVVVTTCGTVDHDLARCGQSYYHGTFAADDVALHDLGVHRIGNVFVPREAYGPRLAERVLPVLADLWEEGLRAPSSRELLWAVGERLGDGTSLLYWCARRRVPVHVPAIYDGAFGSQLWSFWQDHRDFRVDELKDQQELADVVFGAEETGALLVGGGVAKHHTIWWNQFREGLDYAVAITTAVEWDGSLSGARLREAVSWGKVRPAARRVTVEGDASVLLPLVVVAALGERFRRPRD